MSLFDELKRRNVFRVGAAYIVTTWLVVQVVETLFPIYGLSDSAMRMVVNILAIGLVPVLILAWVFEGTPESLKRDNEVEHSQPVSLNAAKKLDRIILAVLALALGYFAIDKFILAPQQLAEEVAEAREEGRTDAILDSYGEQSIAVLAFEDMSPEGDQQYLSEGISEEILNLLAKIPEIRVISRSSAFSYKDKNTPIPQIAEELKVAHVLEGSVRKAGDRIRITAQLIEGSSDTHIWSETYDRTLDDVFAIQDEIAAAMVEQMKISLLGDVPKTDPIDPDAYVLYLQGEHFLHYGPSRRAIEFFRQAVDIQADYIDAWVGLAYAYYFSSSGSEQLSTEVEKDEPWRLSDEAFTRAEALNPDHPSVLVNKAWNYMKKGDYITAALFNERAVEMNARHWFDIRRVIIFAMVSRHMHIAVALAELAVRRDPYCAVCNYWYARALMKSGDFEKAVSELDKFKAVFPNRGGELTLGTARLMSGDPEGALETFLSRDSDLDKEYGRLLVKVVTGDIDGIEAELRAFESQYWSDEISRSTQSTAYSLAELYAALGNIETGFKWLGKVEKNSAKFWFAGILGSPFLVNLHDDPRWPKFEERAGVAPYQLAEIKFNPSLPGR
jgi:adenylate cyclase